MIEAPIYPHLDITLPIYYGENDFKKNPTKISLQNSMKTLSQLGIDRHNDSNLDQRPSHEIMLVCRAVMKVKLNSVDSEQPVLGDKTCRRYGTRTCRKLLLLH